MMQKYITVLLLVISSLEVFAQYKVNNSDGGGRFGITTGLTHYITDTSLLFSKSGTGFMLGIIGTADFSERSELWGEIIYNRHAVKFIGRDNELAAPRDIKFNLQNFNVPFNYNYNFLIKDNLKFGIHTGPVFSFLYEYRTNDESEFVLDPLYTEPYYLQFDTANEQISFNMFWDIGVSALYDSFMASLRYNHGITDPYRNTPLVAVIDLTGKDYFINFSFTYFL